MAILIDSYGVYAYTTSAGLQVVIAPGDFTDRGDYSGAATYVTNDVVTYNNSLFIALAGNTGIVPSGNVSSYWSTLVLLEPGTVETDCCVIGSQAYNLASLALSIATSGTNEDQDILTLVYAGTALAQSAYTIAVYGTNIGGDAYDIAVAGTNLAQAAYALAQIGTSSSAADRVLRAGDTMTGTLRVPNLFVDVATLAYAGTVTVNLNGTGFQSLTLTNDVHIITSNQASGRSATVKIEGDILDRSLSFPGEIRFLGTAPTTLAANKVAMLSFTAFGTTESDVIAAYAAQE